MERARILIVEDEELVALSIQTTLEEIGHLGSRIAGSGEAAIGAIPEFAPDLVLMDIHLGGAMSGTEAARFITESFKLPIVYLTAFSDEKTLNEAKLAEPYGYLVKPFDEKSLQSTIEMALFKSAKENEVKRRKETIESILHSIGEGIIVAGPTGLVEYMNAPAVSLLGQSPAPKTMSLLSLLDLSELESGEKLHIDLEAVLFGGRTWEARDCRIKGPGGKPFVADLHLEPFRDGRGIARGLVAGLRERKRDTGL
jgi:CheY-like chemotaxis protein